MLKKLKKFSQLSFEQKLIFIEAFFTLGMMSRAIHTKELKEITKDTTQHKGEKRHTSTSKEDLQKAKMIGDIVTKASVYTPWQSACLAQSLTIMQMLKRRSISGVFYLAVSKNNDLKAHAWSMHQDTILTGKNGIENFTILSTFEW